MARDGWGPQDVELADPTQPPMLARGTVDRMSAQRSDDAWLDAAWSGHGQVLRITATGDAVVTAGALAWEPAAGARPQDAWFLGADGADGAIPADGAAYFATVVDRLDGGRSLRETGSYLSDRDAGLLTAAVGLAHWHAGNTHCPRDGSPTTVTSGGWVRECPADGSHHFPRTDPAVIMLVTSPDGDSCVLGRQPSWPAGRYSLLAGFVEPGESGEQAVAREVGEEAAIAVRDVRPVGSQPWPFPASLMLGYRAVAEATERPNSYDDELEDVRWFTRQEIRDGAVLLPPPTSIANWIIAGWLAEQPSA